MSSPAEAPYTNYESPPSPSQTPYESPPPPPDTQYNSTPPLPETGDESRSPPSLPTMLVPPSSKGTSVGLIAGVVIGGVLLVLAAVCIFIVCHRRKRKKSKQGGVVEIYNGELPGENIDDQFKGPPQNLQQNYTPPSADKIEIFPMPTHFRAPSSTGSCYGSEKPSPAFGFSGSTFTYEELVMATNGFSNDNLLGQGGFGFVHKGILPNGKVVTINS